MSTTYAPPPGATELADPTPADPAAGPTSVVPTKPGSDAARTMYALLATCLGIIPLNALLRESGWLWDAWLAMLVVIGPAALMRLRWRASTLQIWVGVVLLVSYLTVRFLHQHAIWGVLPGPATWHDVHLLLVGLHHTTSTGIAPVHTTNAIRLVLCALLPLVAALVDMVAVVARRGALAGIPLLVIYTVSGAVPRHPVAWPLFIFAAIAFLMVLALDSRDDAQRWGHFVPRTGLTKSRAAGAISAQRIAVVAVLVAVLVPAFVQAKSKNLLANAFHDGAKLGTSGGTGFGAGGTAGIDPFVTLRGDLVRNSPVNLLDVHVQRLDSGTDKIQPFYARVNVLSTYNGSGWVVGDVGTLEPLLTTGFDSTPGTNFAPVTALFRAEVTIDKLTADPPVFVQPRQLDGEITSATQWSPTEQLLIGGTTHSNQKYNVTFQQPDPTAGQLEAANAIDPALAPWLKLPQTAASVQQLVARLTASADTQYSKALAIDDYFTDPKNGFGYNLHVPAGPGPDPLVNFLQNKIGFCQQYAAAMGVMLRLAGVPSRVVLGYAHSAPNSNGDFTITTDDAHAWVEAYFAGIGWIPFDPTPLNGITDGSKNDLPWAPHPSASNSQPTNTGPVSSASKPNNGLTDSSGPTGPLAGRAHHGAGLAAPVLGGVLLLILAVMAVPWLQRTSRRRRRLSLARNGDADALWAELSDTATDLGYVWSPARTPRQVVDWLGKDAGSARPELTSLAAAVELARYAPPGHLALNGPDLVHDYERVHVQLAAGQPAGVRIRARLLPVSLGWTTGPAGRTGKLPVIGSMWRSHRH